METASYVFTILNFFVLCSISNRVSNIEAIQKYIAKWPDKK